MSGISSTRSSRSAEASSSRRQRRKSGAEPLAVVGLRHQGRHTPMRGGRAAWQLWHLPHLGRHRNCLLRVGHPQGAWFRIGRYVIPQADRTSGHVAHLHRTKKGHTRTCSLNLIVGMPGLCFAGTAQSLEVRKIDLAEFLIRDTWVVCLAYGQESVHVM